MKFKKRFLTVWLVIYMPWSVIIFFGGFSLKAFVGFLFINAVMALAAAVDTYFAMKEVKTESG